LAHPEPSKLAAQIERQLKHAGELVSKAWRKEMELEAVLNALAEPVIIYDADGVVQKANPAAIRVYGFYPVGKIASDLAQRLKVRRLDGTAYRPDELPSAKALSGGIVMREPVMLTSIKGREVIVEVSAVPLTSDGKIEGAVAVWYDVTERERLLKQVGTERARLRTIFDSAPEGIVVADDKARILMTNRTADIIYGWPIPFEQDFKSLAELSHITFPDGSPCSPQDLPLTRSAIHGEVCSDLELAITRQDGQRRDILVNTSPIIGENEKILGAIGVFHDITERKQAERLSNALNSINNTINSTLDFDEIMRRVVVDATKATGCETAAIALRDGDKWLVKYINGLAQEIVGMRFADEDVPHAAFAAQTGEPVVINDTYNDDRVNRELMQKYNLRSVAVVPLIAKEEVIGTLFFNYHSAVVAFADAQIDFMTKLGHSVSLAIKNAGLYEAQRHIADTLQESLLKVPDSIDGIEFGHLYRSATEAARVGGDFYDIFEIEEGKVAAVVGDVSGKGIEAAALTSLIKSAVKAHVLEDDDPSSVMAKINDLVIKISPASNFSTVFLGVIDTATGWMTYCSAGHPPALIRRNGLDIDTLTDYSPVLGAFMGLDYTSGRERLDKDDVLIIYTNGITEARSDTGFFGEKKLVDIIKRKSRTQAKDLARAIFNGVMKHTSGRLPDDVALLTISLKDE